MGGTPSFAAKRALRVLITSAGDRVDIVRALRAAAQGLSIDLSIVCSDDNPHQSAACLMSDNALRLPTLQGNRDVSSLLRICRTEHIDIVLPLADRDVQRIADHEGAFSSQGTYPVACGARTARLITDPQSFRNFVMTNALSQGGGQHRHRGRRFVVTLYFDSSARLRTVVPCELIGPDKAPRQIVTRRDPLLIDIGRRLGRLLLDPRGIITFAVAIDEVGWVELSAPTAQFGSLTPLIGKAGADVFTWLLEDALGIESSSCDDWCNGLIMMRVDAAVFIEPK